MLHPTRTRRTPFQAALAGIGALALAAGCTGEEGGGSPAPTGDGAADQLRIVLMPSVVHFGDVLLNGQSDPPTAVVVKNNSNAATSPLSVNTSEKAFKILNNGCTGPLTPMQSCTVSLVFVPDAVGLRMGTLDVTADGTKTAAMLDGTGVRQPTLSITPATQNFGDVIVGSESQEITFTVKNDGGKEAPRPNVVPSEGFALKVNACATVPNLPPGGMCTVGVVFSPGSLGTRSGTLMAIVPTSTATSQLSGRGVAVGSVLFAPSVIDFGPVVIGKASAAQTLKVSNTGGSAISGVTVAVANSADFAVESKCPATLAPGGTCDVSATFKPTGRGTRAASLIVSFAGNSAMAALSGRGLSAARLVTTPSALDFGQVPVGTRSGALTVTVTNAGDEGAAGVSARMEGSGADQFSATSSCDTLLPGGASCSFAAHFAPTKEGPASADLIVGGLPGGDAKVSLSGRGVAPGKLEVSPLSHGFGTVNVGASSGAVTFTVTNKGDAKTGALKIDKLGADAGDFAIDNDGCTSFELAPAASCSVLARFAPSAPGSKSASLAVSAAPGGTVSAAMMGTAVAPARLVVSPDMADFGRIPLGLPSGVVTFTVSNHGGAGSGPVSVDTGSALFKKGIDNCAARSLAPAESCTVDVQFIPAALGDFKATLTASASPGGTSAPVSLKGAGVTPSSIVFQDGAGISLFVHDFSAADPGGLGVEGTRRFHGQIVGSETSSVTVFVRNQGMTATGLLTTTLAGAHGGDFVVVADGCKGSLDPGAQCAMQLSFKPTAAGNREGAVNVSAASGGTAGLALRGVGLALLEIVRIVGKFEEELVSSFDFGQWPAGKLYGPRADFLLRSRTNASTVSSVLQGETPKNFTKGDAIPGAGHEPGEDACNGKVLDGRPEVVGGANPTFFGQDCFVAIVFGPQREGAVAGTWMVTTSAGQGASLALSGTGTGPLSIQPAPLDFGTVAIGAIKEQVFTVTNAGPNPMTSVDLALSSSQEFAVVVDTCPAAVMTGGLVEDEQCFVTVRFIPAESGAKVVTLTGTGSFLVGGAVRTASTAVAITGNAVAGVAIQVTPGTGAFADTAVGNISSIITFTVANAAGNPPTGKIKVTTSPAQDDIQAEFRLVRNGCVGLNQQLTQPGLPLDSGKSCSFDVRFDPRNVGVRVATLIVQAVEGPGGTARIALSGNGTPTLTLSPTQLDFDGGGNVNVVGVTTNKELDVTIANHALYAVAIGLAIEDAVGVMAGARSGDSALFSVNNPCNAVASGATCKFTVRMQSPAGDVFAGLHKALARVTGMAPANGSPAANAPASQLAGRLTRDARVIVNNELGSFIDFGFVRVGDTSAKQVIPVTNVGGVASGPLSYKFASQAADNTPTSESVVSGDCAGKPSLAPHETCAFELELRPLTVGTLDDNFQIKVTGRGAATIDNIFDPDFNEKIAATAPHVKPTPDFFGTVVAGAPPAAQVTHTLTLFNPSDAAVDLFLDPQPIDSPAPNPWKWAGAGTTPCVFASDPGHPSNHLPASGACTFAVTFAPGAGENPGATYFFAEWCTALRPDNRCQDAGLVKGAGYGHAIQNGIVGRPPTLVVEQGQDGGDFGEVVVQSTSPARAFVVRNVGDAASTPPAISAVDRPDDSMVDFGGGAGGDVGVHAGSNFLVDASGCAAALAPRGQAGDTCTVQVSAKPSAIGGRKAELIATASNAVNPTAGADHATSSIASNPLALRAHGVFDTAIDVVHVYDIAGAEIPGATTVSFGEVPVGAEAQMFVLVAVEGDDLAASTLSYALADGTNFRVDSNPKANPGGVKPAFTNCFDAINAGGGLGAGEQCLLGVFFRPQSLPVGSVSPPNLSTKLTIAAQSGSSANVNIDGHAIAALRLEAPLGTKLVGSVGFDDTDAGKVSAKRVLFVRNQTLLHESSSAPTTGQLGLKLEGANASDFRVVLGQCVGITLDAGGTCEIDLQFEPAGAGSKAATLTVAGNPGNSAAVGLTGLAK